MSKARALQIDNVLLSQSVMIFFAVVVLAMSGPVTCLQLV